MMKLADVTSVAGQQMCISSWFAELAAKREDRGAVASGKLES